MCTCLEFLCFRYLFHEIMLVLYIVYFILFFVPSPLSLSLMRLCFIYPLMMCVL